MGTAQSDPSKTARWMCESSSNTRLQSQSNRWNYYPDVENNIIETAYLNQESKVDLDGFYIDFRKKLQVSRRNPSDQRQIKRVIQGRQNCNFRQGIE